MTTEAGRISFTVAITAGLAAAIILTSQDVVVRTLSAIPLALYLPGRSLAQIVMPKARQTIETTVIAFGLSISALVALGLILHGLGALSSTGWAVSLMLLTWLGCGCAVLRPQWVDDAHVQPRTSVSLGQWSIYAIAVLIAVGAIASARNGALAHNEYSYTEFWMVPSKANPHLATVGLRNAEKARMTYDIALFADDAGFGRWSSISVDAAESWVKTLDVGPWLKKSQRVEAWLYKSNDPGNVYRKVWLSKQNGILQTDDAGHAPKD